MMKETISPAFQSREYIVSDGIKIVNMKQLAFYWMNGVAVYDIYPSNDLKTGDPIMVGVVDRKESQPFYKKWLDMRPKQDEDKR